VTFAELDRASRRIADQLLQDGLRSGDRVGLMLPNVPELAAAYFGILRAGAVAVPLDVELRQTEVAALMADAQARCLLVWRGLLPAGAPGRSAGVARWSLAPGSFFDVDEEPARDTAVVDREAGDTAVIVYTSGTTGQPKGAQLTHANLGRNADLMASLFGFGPDDVVLGALPLTHVFGQTCVLNAAIATGASVVLVPRFEAETVLELLRSVPVTVYAGVPSMYAALLAAAGGATSHCARRHCPCACACAAGRRCRPSCCMPANARWSARCWRATACRRHRRWPPSTTPAASASRARSAPRSRASR